RSRVSHLAHDLDAPVEIAMHQIRGADPVLGPSVVGYVEHPRMLEEPAQDRTGGDVVRQPGNTGLDRAERADQQIDAHAGARRAIQRVDRLLVAQVVRFDLNVGWPPRLRVFDLALDALDESEPDAVRSH